MDTMFNPAHPGELLQTYLGDRSISTVAGHLGVSRVTLSRVLNGHASISADMALRIGKLFHTNPEFWMWLQSQHALWEADFKSRQG
jgi:addiction module HigA family antidote